MRQKSVPEKEPVTQVVKNIRRATRRHFSAEDKIRIRLRLCNSARCEVFTQLSHKCRVPVRRRGQLPPR